MFGKKKDWQPEIKFNGKNIVKIDWSDYKTLDYLIGLGYKIIIHSGGFSYTGIILQKPEELIKSEEQENAL